MTAAKRRILFLGVIVSSLVLGLFAYQGVVRFMTDMRQHAAFVPIVDTCELFHNEYGGYPPSDANDMTGSPYCGAMKLAEATIGHDQGGFHPKSVFRADGLDPNTLASLYTADTLDDRPGRSPAAEYLNVFRLADIYGKANTGPFSEDTLVLCDVFDRTRPGGKKTGMPILYYRADTSATLHDVNEPDNPQNTFDYKDNQALIELGVPGKPGSIHPLVDPKRFHLNIQDPKVREVFRPYRAGSYILISAGRDGFYGTADDICNFDWKYRER